MKKIVISLISIVLLSGAFCPVWAQYDSLALAANEELIKKTNYQPITNDVFQFPTPEEAAKVFEKGKEFLDMMEKKTLTSSSQANSKKKEIYSYLHGSSKKVNSKDKEMRPDLLAFSNLLQEQYNSNNDLFSSFIKERENENNFKHYQDFYKQIVWKADGTPDLTKAATAKAYLAFYNLIHNNGKPSRLQVGRIDEHFPLLGVYGDFLRKLQNKFGDNDAYVWFSYWLYFGWWKDEITPQEEEELSNEFAKQMLYDDFKKYGFKQQETDQWIKFATSLSSYAEFSKNATGTTVPIRAQGNWYLTVFIRPSNDQYMTALHEFQHVKDFFPGANGWTMIDELPTKIQEIVVRDTIYREIHNITDPKPVKYNENAYIEENGIYLGEIAVFFQNLIKKYKSNNYSGLLLTPEASNYIKDIYDKHLEYLIKRDYKIDPSTLSKKQLELVKKEASRDLRESTENKIKEINSSVRPKF